MAKRFLLYIDILGFSDLVTKSTEDVAKLYKIIDSLNVHRHDVFETIIFSDTILVYNKLSFSSTSDANYLVMYLCEFAKDLEYRLTSEKIFFRAYLTIGDFVREQLENCTAFYGEALIKAYNKEKEIEAIGLFMDDKVKKYSDIFFTQLYKEKAHFVFTRQVLEAFSKTWGNSYPLDHNWIEQTDEIWFLANDIIYLKNVYLSKMDLDLPEKVRKKHHNTWEIYKQRYPKFLETLENNKFNPNSICHKVNWEPCINRVITGEENE